MVLVYGFCGVESISVRIYRILSNGFNIETMWDQRLVKYTWTLLYACVLIVFIGTSGCVSLESSGTGRYRESQRQQKSINSNTSLVAFAIQDAVMYVNRDDGATVEMIMDSNTATSVEMALIPGAGGGDRLFVHWAEIQPLPDAASPPKGSPIRVPMRLQAEIPRGGVWIGGYDAYPSTDESIAFRLIREIQGISSGTAFRRDVDGYSVTGYETRTLLENAGTRAWNQASRIPKLESTGRFVVSAGAYLLIKVVAPDEAAAMVSSSNTNKPVYALGKISDRSRMIPLSDLADGVRLDVSQIEPRLAIYDEDQERLTLIEFTLPAAMAKGREDAIEIGVSTISENQSEVRISLPAPPRALAVGGRLQVQRKTLHIKARQPTLRRWIDSLFDRVVSAAAQAEDSP